MYTNMNGRMLQQQQQQQQQQQNLQNKHTQIMGFTQQQQVDQQQTQLSMKQPNYTYNNNNNNNNNNNPSPSPTQKPNIGMTQMTNSTDDDETNCSNDQENNSSDSKRKSSVGLSMSSQWQRMKWTDNMVRLLIMAVYYIGDEAGGGGPETGPEKKKSLGALQKKGKWKSVSKAMMEKGFYVSPQQCEDKFNDLNKRYKRVNDILGRGTACKVVENQSLLEGMDVAPKLKDEVKKLLNSKHLFFREMCAYHNSCGHVTSGGGSAHAGAETVTVVVGPGAQHQQQVMQTQRQESPCLHSGQMKSNGSVMGGGDDEEEDDDEDEEEEDEDEDNEDGNARKRARTMQGGPGFGLSQWGGEVMGMLQDGSKSLFEKKHWVRTQMIELEENGVKFQREALELDKERLKWMKFSSKKEREMERMKIDNEKKRLENERMVLLLRKKEIEFLFIEQH